MKYYDESRYHIIYDESVREMKISMTKLSMMKVGMMKVGRYENKSDEGR